MALQPAVGLGLHYNTSPSLSIPCSISPFVFFKINNPCNVSVTIFPTHILCLMFLPHVPALGINDPPYYSRAWGGVVVKALVGRSRDRSPVVSLGIFSMASGNSMCSGSTQPLKMSTRILLGVKTADACGFKCRCHGICEP
jgi:hypothetical protein